MSRVDAPRAGAMARAGDGHTLVELLAILAVIGLAIVAAGLHLKPFDTPVESAAAQLAGTIRLARSRAMATTSSYRVRPETSRRIGSEYAESCGAGTWTGADDLELDLPDGVTTADTSWSVCFNPRGIADTNLAISLDHPDDGEEQVEVLLGGAVRVNP